MLSPCALLRLPLWSNVFTKLKFFAYVSLLFLIVCPTTWAAEPYTLAQIQAERLELADVNFGSRETRSKEIDRRIKIAEGDAPRVAGLYLIKAHIFDVLGPFED